MKRRLHKNYPAHFRKGQIMTTNDILELVRAGYSKSEIEAMNGDTEKTDSEPKAEQENNETIITEVKKIEPKYSEVKPFTEDDKKDFKELADLVKNLTDTVKAMQADNAKKVSGEPPKTETADSAIRSFFGEIPKK